ncbi:MAG: sigma-54-dependent Fis family transcriptional regulator [Hyphomicrobiales bacterium]
MNQRTRKPGRSDIFDVKVQAGTVKGSSKFNYDERNVMTAWESFVTGGGPQDYSNVRSLVRDSWNRCKSLGIDAHGTGAPLRNDLEYLNELHEDNHDLLTAAADSLAMLRHLLDNTSAMIILTDRDGVILESFGDSRTIEAGRDIHLEVGGGWNESAAGTNGIGTALRTGKPVLIHAAEHYCQDVKAWTCAAAPIFEPFDGSIVGVVDLSGPTEIFQRHNMTVPVIAARQIEQILHQRGSDERVQLMEACFNSAPTINEEDGLVVLDRHGRVVCHKNAPGMMLEGKVERLMRTGDSLFSPKADMTEADIAASLPEEFTPQLIKHLSVDGKVRGTVLVFESKRRPAAKPATPPVERATKCDVPMPTILGEAKNFRQVIDVVRRVACGSGSVLIQGETGVGKELIGRLFHAYTARTPEDPFVTVNCGAITKDLFGGELFGHVSGAFTGALREGKKGKFEEADGGVLCLDEVGEMPLDVQPFLLRALEDKVIYRLGDSKARPVNVRLVAQTNRNLLKEVEAGKFRKDLYYRIGAIKISVPPLRDRGGDVAILLDHFNRAFADELTRDPLQFTEAAIEALSRYPWPGNVRELRNLIENLHLTSPQLTIKVADLINSGIYVSGGERHDEDHRMPGSTDEAHDLDELQSRMIKKAIRDNDGNLTLAARQIGVARSTLYRKMAQYNIQRSYG